VGHLQSNKARAVQEVACLIHSVDRIELARRISQHADPARPQRVLVQVNTSGEDTKSGVAPRDLTELLDGLQGLPGLAVEGLMTIGPLTDDPARVRAAFRQLREARDRERDEGRPGMPLRELSMGMSGDLEIAIEEGATWVRVGHALFGPREG
jgi:pyridoxal phosphate enzyme (YggS family)